MTKQDHRVSMSASVSISDAYDKIARVSEWWTKFVDGNTRNVGDVFTVRFSEEDGGTFVTFAITEAVPGSRVVWHVTDCYLPWLTDKTEWNDTNVVFEISTNSDGSTVIMTHEGLTPEVECFDACVKGWDYYIGKSLKQFVAIGEGLPNQR